jgi:hypothetical protein
MQDLSLDLQEISLDGGGAADAPQQGCKTQHELAFDGCAGVIICNNGCFKRLVIPYVFQGNDNGFGRQAVSDRIVPRSPLAIVGFRASTEQRIASIGFDLSKRGHALASPPAFREARLSTSLAGEGPAEF